MGGPGNRRTDDVRMECKTSWNVYDPSKRDPVWQVPAGTAFVMLPVHWGCPQCDGDREQFMVVEA